MSEQQKEIAQKIFWIIKNFVYPDAILIDDCSDRFIPSWFTRSVVWVIALSGKDLIRHHPEQSGIDGLLEEKETHQNFYYISYYPRESDQIIFWFLDKGIQISSKEFDGPDIEKKILEFYRVSVMTLICNTDLHSE